jgi:hypothetical protein
MEFKLALAKWKEENVSIVAEMVTQSNTTQSNTMGCCCSNGDSNTTGKTKNCFCEGGTVIAMLLRELISSQLLAPKA